MESYIFSKDSLKNVRQLVRNVIRSISQHDIFAVKKYLRDVDGQSVSNVLKVAYKGQTCLQIALREKDIDIIKELLNAGVDVNQLWEDDTTPLILSCRLGSLEFVQLLIEAGADVNQPNSKGLTALSAASASGSKEIVKLLLRSDAMIDFTDGQGQSALHEAVNNNHLSVVDTLARQGCDVNQIHKGRMTPVMCAASLGLTDIIQVLLLADCQLGYTDVSGCTALHLATNAGHVTTVRLLLQSGADPNAQDNKRVTPLLCAVSKQYHSIVELILSHPKGRCSIDIPDYTGTTPILLATNLAIQFNQYALKSVAGDIFMSLLNAGCNVDLCQQSMGWNPLFVASFSGNQMLMEELLKLKPDVLVRDKCGDCLLHPAMVTSKTSLIQLLIESGCDVNACNKNNEAPLHRAVFRKCNPEIIKLLLDSGALLDTAELSNNLTALHIAVQVGYTEAALLLVERGCNINATDAQGTTALTKAIENNQSEVVNTLLSLKHCNVNLGKKMLPLHAAVLKTDESLINKLSGLGANLNKADSQGVRPIQIAIESNQRRIIRALVSLGCVLDMTESEHLLVPKACCRTHHDPHPHIELQPLFACVKFDDVELFEYLLFRYHRQPSRQIQVIHDMLSFTADTPGNRMTQMISSEGRKHLIELLRDQIQNPWSLLDLCRGQVRLSLGRNVSDKIRLLKLPPLLKHYLLFDRNKELDLSDLEESVSGILS